jgi:xylan 1,4-beta-xylosidase
MLSRLGTTRLATTSTHAWSLDRLDEPVAGMPEEVDALATYNGSDHVSVLVWRHADDQYLAASATALVDVVLDRLPFDADRVRARHWRIDHEHSNSHTAWQAAGSPQDPSDGQLRAIKDRQHLELLEPDRELSIQDGRLTFQLSLPLPSVSLLEIQPQ